MPIYIYIYILAKPNGVEFCYNYLPIFFYYKIKEWYDDENKLVRLDHQPLLDSDIEMFGKTSLSEIHDFKRGIRFIIDKKSEKCLNYTVLEPQALDSDYANNTNFVRLRTSLELFNFDKNASVQYQYHGSVITGFFFITFLIPK
jgi:hypothetical protein